MTYSVAICTYNGERFILEQLESIVSQTISPSQIVLSDDCSTDNTLTIVKELEKKHPGINWKILINKSNQGYLSNFQRAISECDHSIIFLSDQDDFWKKNKAEVFREIFIDPEVLVAFSDAEIVDKDLEFTGTTMFRQIDFNLKEQKELGKPFYSTNLLLKKHLVTGATMAIRSTIVPCIFPIPENSFYIHDGWIATVGSLLGKIMFVPETLILYRQHGSNAIGAYSSESRVYPQNRYDRLIFLLENHYQREKVIWDFIQHKQPASLTLNKKSFLENRIKAYNTVLNTKSILRKLIVILNFGLIRSIPEFNSLRSYFGNSFIYIFKLK